MERVDRAGGGLLRRLPAGSGRRALCTSTTTCKDVAFRSSTYAELCGTAKSVFDTLIAQGTGPCTTQYAACMAN